MGEPHVMRKRHYPLMSRLDNFSPSGKMEMSFLEVKHADLASPEKLGRWCVVKPNPLSWGACMRDGDNNNQKKGGGPKTPAGKRRSARNSTKHGFFIARVLPDEEKEARTLHAGFVKELQPEGPVELEIIGDIVINRLQKKRLDRNEAYEFDLARRKLEEERLKLRDTQDTNGFLRIAETYHNPIAARSGRERLPPQHLIEVLRDLRDDVAKPDIDIRGIRTTLQIMYGTDCSSGAGKIACMSAKIASRADSASAESLAACDAARANLLATIDDEIERQRSEQERQTELDAIDFSRNTPIVPPELVVDRNSRYRASNQREFTQLLKQLRTLRRLKNGD
jgi:hypothetical protein